jgi:hypothetical protein
MDSKRLIIGTIVGGIVLYVVGSLFWGMMFADFFESNVGSATGVTRDPQLIWSVVIGTLAYGMLLTLSIESQSGSASVVDGAKVGAVVGMLIWITADFILYGTSNVSNLTGTVADTALEFVRGGVCGAVIAATLAKIGSN